MAVWEFIKARRTSTKVFVISLLVLFLSILIFNATIAANTAALTAYIETTQAGEQPNYGDIMPCLVAFGFVILTFIVWGASFIFLLFRGVRKSFIKPMVGEITALKDLIPPFDK